MGDFHYRDVDWNPSDATSPNSKLVVNRLEDDFLTQYVKKCKVMHFGINNPHFTYIMNGTELECTKAKRDLGVLLTYDLKVAAQCMQAYKKATEI